VNAFQRFMAGCAALLLVLFPGSIQASGVNRNAQETVVVYNGRAPGSRELARFYAGRRGIPESQVLGLDCAPEEEISRAGFDQQIAGPLRSVFLSKGWWVPQSAENPGGGLRSSRIRFLAVLKGIPLRVGAVEEYPGDEPAGPEAVRNRNEASVDSELAILGGWSRSISGALVNPCFRSVEETTPPGFLWVGRLDGPSDDVVRRMILDGLDAERTGLGGFVCVDSRGIREGAYGEGDRWLEQVARQARLDGFPVVWDRKEPVFAEGLPLRRVAVYMGWYAEHASGAAATINWAQGAVAVHIHSFSARTVRDPRSHWCGPLLAGGAAATLGNVAEPYLALTANLDVFWQRLSSGYTLAQSGWMAQPVVSWMSTVLGDPLYRPFATSPELSKPAQRPGDWSVCREAGKLWGRDPEGARAQFRREAEWLRSGFLWESLGLLEKQSGNLDRAAEAWGCARETYTAAADRLRVLGWEWECRSELGVEWKGREAAAREGWGWVEGEKQRAWWGSIAGPRP
jgi:uncharacterized protein (TIGR03790 family)